MALDIVNASTVAGLKRVAEQLTNTRPLLIQVGYRGNAELRSYFLSRNLSSDLIKGRRGSGFWRDIAGSVSGPTLVGGKSVRVSVTDYRFNQKVFGGPIRPKTKESLTIPVADEARGVAVSVFEHETGIELFRLKKKGGGLTRALAGELPGGGIKVFYILSSGVTQEADPEALPPRDKFNAALLDEADQTLRRALDRA